MKDYFFKLIHRVLAGYARKVIQRHKPFVIAITGSVGKTSAKEAVYEVMRNRFGSDVRKNFGNLNSEIGVPLTILGYEYQPRKVFWPIFLFLAWRKTRVRTYPKYLVLEMGVARPGDVAYLCSIVKPDIAIITSTTSAHLANFSDLKSFEREKISLLEHLNQNGGAILNYDDPALKKVDKKVVSVAINNDAEIKAEDIKLSLSGTEFRISATGHKISIKSHLLGEQMIYPYLFAFGVAQLLKFPLIETGKALEGITPTPGRMNLIEGKKNISIIDDSYNANPASVKKAIDFLDKIRYSGRKVLVLGNMNELGEIEKEAHEEVGRFASGKVDFAIFCGPNSLVMKNAFDEDNSVAFASTNELLKNFESYLREGDLVLIKASQNNNYLEEAVKKIMKNPKAAGDLLVRQGKMWSAKKSFLFK